MMLPSELQWSQLAKLAQSGSPSAPDGSLGCGMVSDGQGSPACGQGASATSPRSVPGSWLPWHQPTPISNLCTPSWQPPPRMKTFQRLLLQKPQMVLKILHAYCCGERAVSLRPCVRDGMLQNQLLCKVARQNEGGLASRQQTGICGRQTASVLCSHLNGIQSPTESARLRLSTVHTSQSRVGLSTAMKCMPEHISCGVVPPRSRVVNSASQRVVRMLFPLLDPLAFRSTAVSNTPRQGQAAILSEDC